MAISGEVCTSLLGSMENVWVHAPNSPQLTPPHHEMCQHGEVEKATEPPLEPEQESGFPIPQRSHWPGGLHVLREKWVTEHSTRLSLGRTLRLAPNHPLPAFPPLLHKSLLRHQFCQHPDAGQQASRTRQSERCSLVSQSYGAEQAGAGFHTQIPSCGRDTIQPTGCLPRAPPLYSPMIHSGHFLMTSFLVTNSFSSHI